MQCLRTREGTHTKAMYAPLYMIECVHAMSVPNLVKLGALEARIFVSEYFFYG